MRAASDESMPIGAYLTLRALAIAAGFLALVAPLFVPSPEERQMAAAQYTADIAPRER